MVRTAIIHKRLVPGIFPELFSCQAILFLTEIKKRYFYGKT